MASRKGVCIVHIQKLSRLERPVPLLAAFPFQIRMDGPSPSARARPESRTCSGKRDYSTCVEEESVGLFNSKNDVKKDD
jgi:hypothetical protein